MKTKVTASFKILAAFLLVSTLAACAPSNSDVLSTALPGTDTDNSQSVPGTEDPSTPTLPEPDDEIKDSAKSLKIHAFADMNIDTSGTYANATISIVKSMISRQPAAILGVGDYIDGEKKSLSDSTYVNMWNQFSKKVLSFMRDANIPFLPTPGNHDAYYAQERRLYDSFWGKNKPNVEYVDDDNFPFYYSFIKEDVFFVSLDDANYSRLSNRTAQLAWLKEQLSSARAKGARARVVYGHIPLYSIVSSKANSSTVYENGVLAGERRTAGSNTLESILLSHNVDLVIFGHSHGFYSGHYTYPDGKKLQVVSMPCAGSSPRYLVGTSIRTPQGYVELVFSETNQLTIRYYNSSGTLQSLSSLPAALTLDSKNGVKYVR
ncbi:metallophosphoesterase [Bdellovibrio bacteriovorus]|uniref:Probable phosphoesterase n=1 Tax=Bdellovibrio bacteriovorus (strain ATCC 15356 / DSM 50701 / NCIMB 9529 / HD100) TaxID=264462 RepID=Q6MKA1_BDEBA|nr:metallophosphoesterase [Bdellovibrio bacteriovorus]CAE80308.1 probable phosphoesterase [Bdellovibrio bacteriovorus HD100]